jgi:2-polyprenyl-3-methyl-5-hydroxy-6-metoxy-1,4-benzoquinol methylase
MANARGKKMDNTHLSIDQAEARGFLHRDYIAHCLRWSHVCRDLNRGQLYKTADILDIGCGKEVPLAKLMYSSRLVPETGSYTGVDINRLEVPDMFHTGKFDLELLSETDVCEHDFGGSTFRVITCFEVMEHVEPEQTLRMLKTIHSLLEDGGQAYLSTPCYDEQTGAAANHVNEMTYGGFGALIEYAGLHIDASFGTFASMKDYKHMLNQEQSKLFDSLREYYDTNYLATIFAPLFPAQSRNALWKVSKQSDHFTRANQFPSIKTFSASLNSSSATWTDFINSLE